AGLAGADGPVLVVATADDSADAGPVPWSGEVLPLGPLGAADGFALIAGLVPLDGELAGRLVEQAAGNPRYVVELLTDWVQRGMLTASTAPVFGWCGPRGAALPPSWTHSLGERLAAVTSELGPDGVQGLELLAILGMGATAEVYAAAVVEAELADTDAIDRLCDRRLAVRSADGIRFTHPAVRDALVARAVAAGHAPALRLAAARAVDRVDPLAAAILRADADDVDALPGLLRAIHAAQRLGERARPARGFASYVALLDRQAVPETHRTRVHAAAFRVTLGLLGLEPGVDALADRAVALAEACGAPDGVVEALVARIRVHRSRGRYAELCADVDRCRLVAELLGDRRSIAEVVLARSNAAIRFGRFDEALAGFAEARAGFEALGDTYLVASTWLAEGAGHGNAGDARAAEAALRRAAAAFAACGSAWGTGMATADLGSATAALGRRDEARPLFERALATFEAIGHPDAAFARLGLAQLDHADGIHDRARLGFDRVIDQWTGRAIQAVVRAYRLPCLAALAEWGPFDVELPALAAELARTGIRDALVPTSLIEAGDRAARAGQVARAEAAYGVAAAITAVASRGGRA
ncbi:MAG: tetratricopeptide repeat protein, partial [Myxococcota bacterium]